MPSEREAAIQAVVDAWNVPGVDPGEHQAWQAKLQQHSPDGWPALAHAVIRLSNLQQERKQGRGNR